jgi:hypothetical protein
MDCAQMTLPHAAISISPYQVIFGSELRQIWYWVGSEKDLRPLVCLNY